MRRFMDNLIIFFGITSAFIASISAVAGAILFLDGSIKGNLQSADPRPKISWLFIAAGGLFICSFLLRKWYRTRSRSPAGQD